MAAIKTVTIVPADDKDGYQRGFGTKLFTPDGAQIPGIKGAEISIKPDELISAKLEMFVWFARLAAVPGWYAHDPETKEIKKIRSIVWDDGTRFDG